MIQDSIVNDYVLLAKLFGSCIHRVQGPGGNISIKENKEMIIKTSGTCLNQTTISSGYVVCNINSLKEKLDTQDENVLSCVERGDLNKPPSLECFFHLLPSRIIVHIHPTCLLSILCSKEAKTKLTIIFPNSLVVPYQKPGITLGKTILDAYNNESFIFLENHGVILCADTIESIIEMYGVIESRLNSHYSRIEQEYSYIKKWKLDGILKPSYIVKPSQIPTTFPALTPDQYLFLKKSPFIINQTTDSFDASKYSIIVDKTFVYIIGKTIQQCQYIEEILLSFLEFYKVSENILSQENLFEITGCPKEIYRLSLK